jgi:hypothetical protein
MKTTKKDIIITIDGINNGILKNAGLKMFLVNRSADYTFNKTLALLTENSDSIKYTEYPNYYALTEREKLDSFKTYREIDIFLTGFKTCYNLEV